MNQTNLSKLARTFRLLLLIAVIASAAIAGTVFAKYDEGADVTVSVTRLKGIDVGILIEFPNALTGDFGLVINGKTFDCEQVAETKLYCTGPFRPGDSGILNVYSTAGTTIYSGFVNAPPSNEPECEGNECDPPEPECEGRDCEDKGQKCVGPDCVKIECSLGPQPCPPINFCLPGDPLCQN